MDYAKLKIKLEQNTEQDKKERENIIKRIESNELNYSKKFDEIYKNQNVTSQTLIELTTTIKMMTQNMNQQFSNLEKKIDEIKESNKHDR